MQNREPEETSSDSYYVYMHLKKDGTPFYVGMGKNKRAYELKTSRRSLFWTRAALKEYGNTNEVTVKFLDTNLDEHSAKNLEILAIGILGRRNTKTGPLVNLTDGGEGVQGVIRTDEYKKNISKRMSGKNHPYYGKIGPRLGVHHTEKTKQRLRDVNLGSNNPNFGKERSLESKIKSRNSNIIRHTTKKKIQHKSDIFCNKIAMARSGGKTYVVHSPTGEEMVFSNQTKFARENNLSQQSLNRLLTGKRKNYLGWTLKTINISGE